MSKIISQDYKLSESQLADLREKQKPVQVSLPNGIRAEGGTVSPGETVIRFHAPFTNPPIVLMSICEFDIDHSTNARLVCGPVPNSIMRDGFTASLGTWADTHLYYAAATWIAIGS